MHEFDCFKYLKNKFYYMDKKKLKIKTVEEYFNSLLIDDRKVLKDLRSTIFSHLPKTATEKMSYGMPMIFCGGMFAGYASFKDHYSLFILSGSALKDFEKELESYKLGKGTIQFTKDNLLSKSIIKKLVQAKLEEKKKLGKI